MNFNFEQVMDMGFPVPTYLTTASVMVNYEEIEVNWFEGCSWLDERDPDRPFLTFYYLPTVEEVYATLRSGLFLKYVHSAKDGQVFQFWLSDPGFPEKIYASGRDICEAVCNAYLRSFCSPNNPQT